MTCYSNAYKITNNHLMTYVLSLMEDDNVFSQTLKMVVIVLTVFHV